MCMDYFRHILQSFPVVALFLTVGVGFMLGRLKYKSLSLGTVTSVLIVGIVVGELFQVKVADQIKTVFFMLFLFSIGYSVGPGFFRSLKGAGLRQVVFAVAMGFCCFAVTVGVARLMHYNAGETVGLFAGSQTCSSLIGVGSEAIGRLPISETDKAGMLDMVPVCYAVTYVFGTLGTVVFLSILAPRMLGGIDKVKKETEALESDYQIAPWRNDPAYIDAMAGVAVRTYAVALPAAMRVKDLEHNLAEKGWRVYVSHIYPSMSSVAVLASGSRMVKPGDIVAVTGRLEHMVGLGEAIGPETVVFPLEPYPVMQMPVRLQNMKLRGEDVRTLQGRKFMHGAVVKDVERDDKPLEMTGELRLEQGDRIILVGNPTSVERAAAQLGHVDRPTTHTDLMFLCLALFIGGVAGTLTVVIRGIPLSFGTSGGALISGLVFGWLRSKRPTYGKIPRSVLWFLNQLGLTMFIGVVGINCGPEFVSGIKAVGWMLPVAGAVATMMPLLLGVWLGAKVFKFPAVFTLGCCAGTRTSTASLGAVQDVLGSTLPTIGYTVTYAVSNILLIVWGLLAVMVN